MELSNNTSELFKAIECVVICYSSNRNLTQLMMIPYGNPEPFPKTIRWTNHTPVTQKDPEASSMWPVSGSFCMSLSSMPGICKVVTWRSSVVSPQTVKLRPQPFCVGLWIQWPLWPEIWGGSLIPSHHPLGPQGLTDQLLTQLSAWLNRLYTLLYFLNLMKPIWGSIWPKPNEAQAQIILSRGWGGPLWYSALFILVSSQWFF